MRYSAYITVVDDQGEVAYERELTADEIVEELLERKDAPVVIPETIKVLGDVEVVVTGFQKEEEEPVPPPAPVQEAPKPVVAPKRGKYDDAFKARAIGLAQEYGDVSRAAAELGVSGPGLRNWFVDAGLSVPKVPRGGRAAPEPAGDVEEDEEEEAPPAASGPDREFNAEKDGAIPVIKYIEIKEKQSKGKPSMVIASELRFNLREVNFAMRSVTHQEYLKLRKG